MKHNPKEAFALLDQELSPVCSFSFMKRALISSSTLAVIRKHLHSELVCGLIPEFFISRSLNLSR